MEKRLDELFAAYDQAIDGIIAEAVRKLDLLKVDFQNTDQHAILKAELYEYAKQSDLDRKWMPFTGYSTPPTVNMIRKSKVKAVLSEDRMSMIDNALDDLLSYDFKVGFTIEEHFVWGSTYQQISDRLRSNPKNVEKYIFGGLCWLDARLN